MRAVAWAPLRCVLAGRGGECGDMLTDAQCVGSTWKCPTGTIAAVSVVCFERQADVAPQARAGGACGSETVSPICGGGTLELPGRDGCPPTTVPACSPGDG